MLKELISVSLNKKCDNEEMRFKKPGNTMKKLLLLKFVALVFIQSCAHYAQEHKNFLASSKIPLKTSNIKAKIIIDPGHGGKDSGAVGRQGLKEKDLTLDIGKRAYHLFKKVMPNAEVILTRKADRFVSLEERVSIANKNRGDVFISLHINSSENNGAKGFEVYSLDVASDRHSERLAARENKSFAGENKGVNFILADLRAYSNRNDSNYLAKVIAGGLNSQFSGRLVPDLLNDRGYNQAIFQVLFVEMPAVLTELFFISNPKEERLLKSEVGRELCARGIVLGVAKFLENSPSRIADAKP